MRVSRLLSIAMLALAPLATARAQERNYTITGSGSLELGRGQRRVDRVTLTLTDRGDFAATAYADGERYALRGQWTRRGGLGADERIRIEDAFGDSRANGSGVLTFRDNRSPRALDLSGQSRSGRFRLSIEGDAGLFAGGGPWSDAGRGVSLSTDGRGTVRVGRSDRRVSDASVELQGNGQALVRMSGDGQLQLTGRWERAGDDRYRVRVSRVNGAPASGTVMVALRDTRYARGRSDDRGGRYDSDARGRGRYDRRDEGSGIASMEGDGRFGRDLFRVEFRGR